MMVNAIKTLITLCAFSVLAVTSVQAAPQDKGSWTPVVEWPIIAIHTVLTPEGKVLSFGSSSEGLQGAELFDVWDPELGMGTESHYTLANSLGVDSFCSAAILLPETGNILMSGGDNRPNGFPNVGINDAPIFNTQTNSISQSSNMANERWYPTATTLSNGDVLLTGGDDAQGRLVPTPEVYSPENNEWRSLLGVTANWEERVSFYPRQWVAPNGKIFGYDQNRQMYYIDPEGDGSLENLGYIVINPEDPDVKGGDGVRSAAVMYQPGKILKVGGRWGNTDDATIIDINTATPAIRAVPGPTEKGRIWVNSVVLPNGKVIIFGGAESDSIETDVLEGESLRPELWDPATETWTLMEAAVKARLYHSTAMLLKDGRILTAGGGAPGPQTNLDAEIFTPPYLYDSEGELAPRPTIVSAPAEGPYGSQITVNHDPNDIISRVTLIKTGAVTHSSNMEQRFLELDFQDIQDGVSVNLPNSPNLATPGYYLLHLLDDKGVPSVAHIIRISSSAEPPINNNARPTGGDDSAEVSAGQSVSIDVLANDTGTNLTIDLASSAVVYPARKTDFEVVENQLVYTNNPAENGDPITEPVIIYYVIRDVWNRANWATLTINIVEDSGEPVVNDDAAEVTAGGTVTVDVLENDNGINLTVASPISATQGSVEVVNNKLVYTANIGSSGEEVFNYTVTDDQERSGDATVTITIVGDIGGPVGNDDADAEVGIGESVTIDVLNNDTGTNLTIDLDSSAVVYPAKKADFEVVDNKLVYTNNPTQSGDPVTGQAIIYYVMKDDLNRTNWATVTIDILENSDGPVANDDVAEVTVGGTVTVDAIENDTGADLTITTPVSSTQGSVEVVENKIVYTANADASGEEILNYTVTDAQDRSAEATVTITFVENSGWPFGEDDTADVITGGAVTIDVLNNDTGTNLTIESTLVGWPVENDHVTVEDNKLIYTHITPGRGGYPVTSPVTIYYVMKDDLNRSNWASVTVNISSNETVRTYIIAGQSNAEGLGLAYGDLPSGTLDPNENLDDIGRSDLKDIQNSASVFNQYIPTWNDLGPGYGMSGNGIRFGPELSFNSKLQETISQPIRIIKFGIGGTSLFSNWQPDGGNNSYSYLIDTVNDAKAAATSLGLTLDIRGLLWMQGESDSLGEDASQAYESNLNNFISSIRTDLNLPDLQVHIGQIADSNVWVEREQIWAAQEAIASSDNNAFLVDGKDLELLTDDGAGGNQVHYSTRGNVELGERFADSVINAELP